MNEQYLGESGWEKKNRSKVWVGGGKCKSGEGKYFWGINGKEWGYIEAYFGWLWVGGYFLPVSKE